MKKYVLTAVMVAMIGMGTGLKAQNCDEIVRPYLEMKHIQASEYPTPKFEWRCAFSRSAFYLTDTIREGATVFEMTALTNIITKQHPKENYVVDLNVFSYWAWNFIDFQKDDQKHTIYFDTHKTKDRYLAVRCIEETYDRADWPEKYKDEQ